MVDGKQTTRMGAAAVSPDQGTGGTGVGQRLIPEEPMVRPPHLLLLMLDVHVMWMGTRSQSC
jgi:hypothetical protein